MIEKPINVYLGIDVGSVSIKYVLLNDKKEIIDKLYIKNTGVVESAKNILTTIDSKKFHIVGIGITGSGKDFVAAIVGADIIESEIIAHVIATQHFYPNVSTIFDIGGEDAKLMIIKNKVVQHFAMNTECVLPTDEVITPNFIPRPIKDIRIDEKVMTHLGNFKEVTRTIKLKHDDIMYHIKAGSFTLNVTENHPIFVLKREQEFDSDPKFITPDKVKEGDFIIQTMPHNYPIKENRHAMKNKYGYLRRITSINKEHYKGEVHNLTVKDHNTYVCNNLAVSNCGGGTGATLEAISQRLGVKIEDVGDIASKSKIKLLLPSKCGIFCQSAVVAKLNQGFNKEDILAGVCRGMVSSFLTMLMKGNKLEPPFVYQGATAQNKAIVHAFEEELNHEVIVPKHCSYMGAIGTAILAKEYIEKGHKTNSKRLNLKDIKTTVKIGQGCSNKCEISYIYQGEKLIDTIGNKCGKCVGQNDKENN